MKKLFVAVAGFIAVQGCSSGAVGAAAHLVGANDIVVMNRYLFVTSTSTDELRVLDLTPPNLTIREYVPAPNPLEALSVPVLQSPSMLAGDENWDSGLRTVGSYVYATRPGASEISIVGAADTEFIEERRLTLPGPVTALCARLLTTTSRLFFSTFDGVKATVYSAELPEDPLVLRGLTPDALEQKVMAVTAFEGESIMAVIAIPALPGRTWDGRPFCDTGDCLVISTRRNLGLDGRTVMLDPVTRATAELAFGGPTRTLATHGQVTLLSGRVVAAGEQIYALLNEEACAGTNCGGAVAVETRSGVSPQGFPLAVDPSGLPMLPIRVGAGVPTGLSLVVTGQLATPAELAPSGVAGIGVFDVLAVMTATNGDIEFFDASRMRPLDTDPSAPTISGTGFYTADGTLQSGYWPNGPMLTQFVNGTEVAAIQLTDGYWRSQQLQITWQGTIPGLTLLTTTDADGVHLPIAPQATSRVLPGDLVALTTAAGDCGRANVVAVGTASIDIDAVPPACSNRTRFTVRAGPAAPFVVTGTLFGYLGRGASGGKLVYTTTPVWRPDGWDGTFPALVLQFGTDVQPATTTVQMDDYWLIQVDAHFVPYVLTVDSTTLSCPGAQVPVAVTYDLDVQRVFAAYPSPADGVIEINPTALTPNATVDWRLVTSANGTICYR